MASVWSEGSPSCHMTVGDKRKQYMQVDGPEREELLSLTMLPLDVLCTPSCCRGGSPPESCVLDSISRHTSKSQIF